MDVFDAIEKRYSCRTYEDRAIEPEKLDRVLEAARLAPSARNFQDWRFVVVRDAATRAKLVPAADNQKFVGSAPAVIVVGEEIITLRAFEGDTEDMAGLTGA